MQITRSLSEFGFGMNTARSRENPYVPSSNLFLISPKLASRLEAKCLAVSLSIPAVPACAVESRDKSHACKRFFFERILRGFAISTLPAGLGSNIRCTEACWKQRQQSVDDAPAGSATFAAGTLARVRLGPGHIAATRLARSPHQVAAPSK